MRLGHEAEAMRLARETGPMRLGRGTGPMRLGRKTGPSFSDSNWRSINRHCETESRKGPSESRCSSIADYWIRSSHVLFTSIVRNCLIYFVCRSPVDLKFEVLKRKIGQLEEENKSLKTEATHLFEETEKCEEAEAKLVEDLVAQLESCRFDLDSTGIDIEKSKQREAELKEQVEHLQEKLQTTNERLEKALGENEEYLNMITMLRETQCELATELVEVKEKYSEIVSVVEEMKEKIVFSSNYKKVFETFKTASHSSSLGSSESETPGIIPPRFGSGTMPPPGIGGTMYPGMPGGGSYDASSSTSDIEDDITSTFRPSHCPTLRRMRSPIQGKASPGRTTCTPTLTAPSCTLTIIPA
ncbi:unnamed protein product [Nesidiocoris tenuis]|uniref:HAP1 N-terminal domain-containing protein n=1 Tax=Nesidiocoris tenuis TaxID=355587 RepID=A0A6H5HJC8_9HEMI|nr:unnamed protein product [Nesidiocoris tenuis]